MRKPKFAVGDRVKVRGEIGIYCINKIRKSKVNNFVYEFEKNPDPKRIFNITHAIEEGIEHAN